MKYLIRLDDACPTMNSKLWDKMENILDLYDIKPMVGIIPNNRDLTLEIDPIDNFFWEKALRWQQKKWTIALHGYDHVYISNNGGINPVHNRSEFAGLPLNLQEEKIEKGVEILKEHQLEAKYFFAPSHTFDLNTIIALRNKSEIRNISDTIAFNTYVDNDFVFHPQQFGKFRNIKISGNWTFCFHPNTMSDEDLNAISLFIKENKSKFVSFDEIEVQNLKKKNVFDKIFSFLYFLKRKI